MSEVVPTSKTLDEAIKAVKDKISKMDEILNDLQKKKNNSTIIESEKEILEKYKNYVEYLKKILETKLNLDTNIIDVQQNVFQKLDKVFKKIQGFATIDINKKIKETTLLKKQDTPKIKKVLIDIDKIQKNEELFKELKCERVVDELEQVLNEYEQELINLNIKNTATTGGANNSLIDYGVILSNNNNEKTKIEQLHNEKLNDIKNLYETGLKDSIDKFNEICEALKKLVGSCIEIINKLTKTLLSNKRILKSLSNNDSKKFIRYVGLNLKNFNDTEELFNKNKDALESMMNQITNAQNDLKKESNTIDKPINLQQPQGLSKVQPIGSSVQENPPAITFTKQEEKITSSLKQPLRDSFTRFLKNLKSTNNDEILNTYKESLLQSLKNINDALELSLPNKSQLKVNKSYEHYYIAYDFGWKDSENTNTSGKWTVNMNDKNPPQIIQGHINDLTTNYENSNNKKNMISKAITDMIDLLLHEKSSAEKGTALKHENNTKIKKTQNSFKPQISINISTGGGYKNKSKSKKITSKKTSMKVAKKTSSKGKENKNKKIVKSYNNPKYKNQDGGFVRGGVLFPESFYRSDIVM